MVRAAYTLSSALSDCDVGETDTREASGRRGTSWQISLLRRGEEATTLRPEHVQSERADKLEWLLSKTDLDGTAAECMR